MMKDMKDGRGPIYMDTPTRDGQAWRETMTPKEVKHLEAEAWEDFLDMCIGQCGIWAGENIEPEKKPSEIMPTEPYLLGSHSGCAASGCPARPTWRAGRRNASAPAGAGTGATAP